MIDQLSKTNNSIDTFNGQGLKKVQTPETMTFTPELFQRVISAVLCSFNPTSSNGDKQLALNFLENLKENHPLISLTIGFELIKQLTDQPLLHHYGIHLIESIIKYKWTVLKVDERTVLKEQLFLLVQSTCMNSTFMDPVHIRNALARCLVEMIKRDCFEKINTTLDEIVTMIQRITTVQDTNSTQLELLLLVFRFLNEELTLYSQSLQAQRRRQLLLQLQKRLNDILPCLIRISNELIHISEQRERLTQTCLLAVNSFLVWVEYNHFEQYEHFLCQLFLKFFQLNSVKLRHASFECLLSLVNKRLARRQLQQQQQQRNKRIALSTAAAFNSDQEKLFLTYLLGDNTLEMFYRLLLSPTDSVEQLRAIVTNDHLNCLKMLGQLLVKLANYLLQLFQQLTTKPLGDEQFLTFVNERTRSFLQFLLLLNQHPFHQLSLNSYQALNAFITRQPSLLSNEPFCLKLVENLKQSLHRVHFALPSTTISTTTFIDSTSQDGNETFVKQFLHNQQCFVYALFEYDSEEQFFWKFFSQYRSELQKLIKSFIGMFFVETNTERTVGVIETNMSCLKSILQSLLGFLQSLVQRTPNKSATTSPSSLSSIYMIIEWEAFYLLIDHVLFVVRKQLFSSSSTITVDTHQQMEQLLMTSDLTEQFLRTLRFLLQFTPNLSEHIHGHVLNLLSVMFFITQHDPSLAIQIIQRLLTTFQLYQQQSIDGTGASECEIMQTQASNAFLYLCKNFTVKMMDYYSELFPFICQLLKGEFQMTKTSLAITIDEASCPALKLLDAAQSLLYYRLSLGGDENQIESFYELVKPIYESLVSSLTADSLSTFIQYLDFCSTTRVDTALIRYRRRQLMLALHCLCLLVRISKQQSEQLTNNLRSKIAICLRPLLFDYVLKVTQFCNQLYDRQTNPFYDTLKSHLTYSETEKQLYLGTYESNNMAKATITTSSTPSDMPVNFVRFQTTQLSLVDDQRLRDYFHRLFDICYQLNGMFFAHDPDLYHLKLVNENNYFLTSFLQKILFESLTTLPSFRLRIVLRHFCRSFIEHFLSSSSDTQTIEELFLSFLDSFLPYIQQRLRTMWNNLLTTIAIDTNECSDEVIEECVCVLLTRDFVDIVRYFIFKTTTTTSSSTTNSSSNKKKTKIQNGHHHHSESMCEETNGLGSGETDTIDEWDEQTTTNTSINNKLLNGTQEKLDYSDLFQYMIKMSRQNSPLAIRLFTCIIQTLFECLTFPDAYCINRFLPIILPLVKLYSDITDKLFSSSSTPILIDVKFLFQCLIKSLERHGENEGVNTNLISLIGHIYEHWHNQYHNQLDLVLHQTIPQLNVELLNNYKTRLMNNEQQRKQQQQLTERERRDTIKNLLNPVLLSPVSSHQKKEGGLIPPCRSTVSSTL